MSEFYWNVSFSKGTLLTSWIEVDRLSSSSILLIAVYINMVSPEFVMDLETP